MKKRLVANQHLHLAMIDESSFVLTAPASGRGLSTRIVSKAEQSGIFEVFTDLAEMGFSFLEPMADLSAGDIASLESEGFLVDENAQPERPLFSSMLADIQAYDGEIDVDNLIVSPGFNFQPFDLAKFAALARQRDLSPYNAIAHIVDRVTKLGSSVWLTSAESEEVSTFSAGKAPRNRMGDGFARKLFAAGVLVTPDMYETRIQSTTDAISVAKAEFADQKYSIIRGLFPPHTISAMQRYFEQYVSRGFMPFGDTQVSTRYREHNQPFARYIHEQLVDLMSAVTGTQVRASYVYAAAYEPGSVLEPHVDRGQCEYSMTFQVDYTPRAADGVSPWPIFATPLTQNGHVLSDDPAAQMAQWKQVAETADVSPVHLANGDGMIYKGCELIHFRPALPEGHRSTSLFFHFVRDDFDGPLN